MGSKYLAWRCTYQSSEAAAQAAYRALEELSKQPPAATVIAITTAYEQGFGKGLIAFRTGKGITSPYADEMGCLQAWDIGYKEGLKAGGRLKDNGPKFDAMVPEQETLAVQLCNEISGPRGGPSRCPDPVRLLEMAEALYKAEMGE